MLKKLAAMFLLSIFVMTLQGAATAYGADKPIRRINERAIIPARFAPAYSMNGAEGETFPSPPKALEKIALSGRGITVGVGTVVGTTTYDQQQNTTMGRQIAHRGTGYLHVAWMHKGDDVLGGSARGTFTQAYDLSQCPRESGEILSPGGIRADGGSRSGYVVIDVAPNGCGIPVAHENQIGALQSYTYFDLCLTGPYGLYTGDAALDVFGHWDNDGTGPGNSNIWPKVAMQDGTETVVHLVATEFSSDAESSAQTTSYYRRVGGYGANQGTWSSQQLIDTITNISTTITAEYQGDKVAICWSAPADNFYRDSTTEFDPFIVNQATCDIWYAISTNQGADWFNAQESIGQQVDQGLGNGFLAGVGGNVTTYPLFDENHPDPDNMYVGYADLSCLITTDGNLHVVWNTFHWPTDSTIYRRNSAIFHWSEDNTTPSMVAKADWDTGGFCFDQVWARDVAKMSISECDNKLYTIYTQFGSADNPCDDNSGDSSLVNGYLYMTVSNDDGQSWDRPQKLTTVTSPPDCISGTIFEAGDCNSEYWSSSASFGRVATCGDNSGNNVLDILYINDYTTGGAVRSENSGVWTVNPVVWLETECRDVVLEPIYSDNGPLGYGANNQGDPLIVLPNGDAVDTITISNTGLLLNNISINITYTDGDGWITATPAVGVVPCCGGEMIVEFTFSAPVGAPDPSAWSATIEITHDAADKNIRTIPVTMLVSSTYSVPESAILATACKRINIFNTGQLGGKTPNASLDFIDDCDTFNAYTDASTYLYDGTPIVARIDANGDTLVFNSYSKLFTDFDAMRPMSSLTVDVAGPDYSYATSEFITGDSAIGFIVEYFVPKNVDSCDFIIKRLRWFNRGSTTLSGVLVGEFLDWDVPSDSGSNNGSAFDVSRNLMYQFGGEYGQDDVTEALCAQESNDRFGGVAMYLGGNAPKNARTLDNSTFVYTVSSPHLDPPLSYEAMYEEMEKDGYVPFLSPDPDSEFTDLSTLMTFGEYDLLVGDTTCVVLILATTKTGLDDLKSSIDKGNAYIADHSLDCPQSACDCWPGNANADANANVGDAVYLINFVFKGGPNPTPYDVCSGDANGDCSSNVGDAVYLINFVFKGGPLPVDCSTWKINCGVIQ